MYFPQRVREWLLTCLVVPRAPGRSIAFHLEEQGDEFTLSFEHHRHLSPQCLEPLIVPRHYAGNSLKSCIEVLAVLFRGHLIDDAAHGQLLQNIDKVELHTPRGTVEISA